ncbi:unnamed protein product [Notodromas monacha]|uniref:Sodium-and chloride-dependent glycine transporter 2 n=1 Tax=Notodromas monacha TaxID=399045 RepID=A0A7R9GE05_9CRUS|nr:unnamed protein product [Notodromas monacha]CAG0919253.1 unnamed protein product [Notodromas monacha]
MLEVTEGWHDFGGLKWELVLCLLLAWIIVAASLIKGVQSSGKVVYFTALFPYLVLVILCIQGATLPGASEGIKFYLTPKWELLAAPKVWAEAATQIFYSLGPAFGGLITLSSYNKFKNNCVRDAIVIAFSNCLTSVFAGFAIFSIVGYMAHELGVPTSQVIKSGPGLAFIAYPDAIAQMPLSPVWAVLFFVMLITLGLDSQFTMVETLITALLDEMPHLRSRKSSVVIGICAVMFVLGLSMCARGGIYMFTLIDSYSAGWSLLILALLEIVAVHYVYGSTRFMANIKEMVGEWMYPSRYYWLINWCFLAPGLITSILFFSWIMYEPASYGGEPFPLWVNVIGWAMAFSPLIIFLVMGANQYKQAIRKNLGWRSLFRPSASWGPAYVRENLPSQKAKTDNEISANSGYDNPVFSENPSEYVTSTHL